MARPSAKIPGWEGKFGENKVTIGLQFPAKYIDHVKGMLEAMQSDVDDDQILISFQDAIKLSLLAFFPVPEFEEETIKIVRAYIGNSVMVLDTGSSFETAKHDLPFRPKKVIIGKAKPVEQIVQERKDASTLHALGFESDGREQREVKDFKIPVTRETEVFIEEDTNRYGSVLIQTTRQSIHMTVADTLVQHDVLVEHKWSRKDFEIAELFFESQAKALMAIYAEELKSFPKERTEACIFDAFVLQFDPNPKEGEV